MRCLIVAIGLAATTRGAVSTQATGKQPSSGHTDVKAQCDALVTSAVRTSIGWGWAVRDDATDAPLDKDNASAQSAKPAVPAKPHQMHSLPTIEAADTAAIGLELLWASEILHNDSVRQAAFEAGRGLAALQTHTGQIRSRGVLGAPGAPQAPRDVPDRSATRAALGLWLLLLDAANKRPAGDSPKPGSPEQRGVARIRVATFAAAHWLTTQQTPAGAWPSSYPADLPVGRARRLIRLDLPDYRDNVYALLLAWQVLDDRNLGLLEDRAIDALLAMRVPYPTPSPNRALWASAYELSSEPTRRYAEFPDGIDLLATRYAMQALLADYLLTLRPRGDVAVHESALAVRALPINAKHHWHRFYTRKGDPIEPAAPAFRVDLFNPPDETAGGMLGTFGFEALLPAEDQISKIGGDRFGRSLAAQAKLFYRLAAVLCGLSDDAMSDHLSATPALPAQCTPLWDALRRELNGKSGQVEPSGVQ